jgi:hypothetical protein
MEQIELSKCNIDMTDWVNNPDVEYCSDVIGEGVGPYHVHKEALRKAERDHDTEAADEAHKGMAFYKALMLGPGGAWSMQELRPPWREEVQRWTEWKRADFIRDREMYTMYVLQHADEYNVKVVS